MSHFSVFAYLLWPRIPKVEKHIQTERERESGVVDIHFINNNTKFHGLNLYVYSL